MSEDWKTIEDFPEYQVSTLGRVKSLRFGKEKILKQRYNNYKYLCINLYKDGKSHTKTIHRLVAKAFLKPIVGKDEVDHINQNKSDNRLENLRWENDCGQNLNKPYRLGVSGLRYIRQINNKYRVYITRNRVVYCEYFDTVEQAIVDRDRFLTIFYSTSPCSNQT